MNEADEAAKGLIEYNQSLGPETVKMMTARQMDHGIPRLQRWREWLLVTLRFHWEKLEIKFMRKRHPGVGRWTL